MDGSHLGVGQAFVAVTGDAAHHAELPVAHSLAGPEQVAELFQIVSGDQSQVGPQRRFGMRLPSAKLHAMAFGASGANDVAAKRMLAANV
jgi:hypothetical protein